MLLEREDKMRIIGIDFSINKPAACVYHDYKKPKYEFYSWPFGLSEKIKTIYKEAGIHLTDRTDEKLKNGDISERMRFEVSNANYLASLIFNDLFFYLGTKTFIIFEGLSYASSGNVVLQLGGYKYLLMDRLAQLVPIKNMFTYAPITIKKIAGCSKKGMGKREMVNAFLKTDGPIPFRDKINENPELFQKKTGNWIDHLDDFIDSYWAIKTYLEKN